MSLSFLEEAINDYKSGSSIADITNRYGISWYKFSKELKAREIVIRNANESFKEKNTAKYTQQVLELYKSGISGPKISEQLNISRKLVTRILKENNIEAKSAKDYNTGKRIFDISREELEKLYVEQNMTSRQIADQFNVSQKTVLKAINEYSIEKQLYGTRSLDVNGYYRISFYDENGEHVRMHEHIYVAEQALGRKLLPNEDVHHRDLDKTNNHPSNLRVMDSSAHIRFHGTLNKTRRLKWLINFVRENNRYPKYEEAPFDMGNIGKDWGSIKKAYELTKKATGVEYVRPGEKTKDECLRIMYDFELKTGAAPRMKDFKEFTVGVKWDTVRKKFTTASELWSAYEAYKQSHS